MCQEGRNVSPSPAVLSSFAVSFSLHTGSLFMLLLVASFQEEELKLPAHVTYSVCWSKQATVPAGFKLIRERWHANGRKEGIRSGTCRIPTQVICMCCLTIVQKLLILTHFSDDYATLPSGRSALGTYKSNADQNSSPNWLIVIYTY